MGSRTGRAWSNKEREFVVDCYLEGFPFWGIATRVGRTPLAIAFALKNAGYDIDVENVSKTNYDRDWQSMTHAEKQKVWSKST